MRSIARGLWFTVALLATTLLGFGAQVARADVFERSWTDWEIASYPYTYTMSGQMGFDLGNNWYTKGYVGIEHNCSSNMRLDVAKIYYAVRYWDVVGTTRTLVSTHQELTPFLDQGPGLPRTIPGNNEPYTDLIENDQDPNHWFQMDKWGLLSMMSTYEPYGWLYPPEGHTHQSELCLYLEMEFWPYNGPGNRVLSLLRCQHVLQRGLQPRRTLSRTV